MLSLLSCSSGGESVDTDEIPRESLPCAHDFGEWQTTLEPECDRLGTEKSECKICGKVVERDLPCTLHKPSMSIYPPTCTAEGYTHYECACGYAYDSDFLTPYGHSFAKEVTEPTCTTEGFTHYACRACDYEYTADYVDSLGHSFKTLTTRPTAIKPGYTTYTCECSFTYTDDYIYYSDILENAYVGSSEVMARGIDVSRWNHATDANGNYLPLDWKKIADSGVDFVILKAGSTKSGLEPTFEMDYAGAREAGLEIGVYFYTYATTLEGIEKDARDLLSYINGKKFEYPIYLDLEDSSLEALGKNYLSEMCEKFITLLQSEGYYAGLYSNHNWLTYVLDGAKVFTLYDVWYARYPLSEKPTWNEQKYGKQLGMWQYSESGEIDGLDGSFDLNYAYKDYKEIMQKWELNGF
jgi:GH25 family lysozyme M1 (1,4-beta-N-acetylmuramidase)